jgi:hypothetical protein
MYVNTGNPLVCVHLYRWRLWLQRMAPGYDIENERKRRTAAAVDAVASAVAHVEGKISEAHISSLENVEEKNDEKEHGSTKSDVSDHTANVVEAAITHAVEHSNVPASSAHDNSSSQNSSTHGRRDDITALNAILEGLPTDKLPDFFVMGYAGEKCQLSFCYFFPFPGMDARFTVGCVRYW